ncbi:transcription termination/antitermination factor NusG [bacterium]|nr:transcription termination/antitermination factor NusG [bacterium]
MEKKWYAIHIHSGFENKVKIRLEREIKLAGMDEFVSQILIPTENVVEVKAGQKKVSSRKFFPGYILIEMEMNDEVWQLIRNIHGVSGFIGNKKKAVSLSEKEIQKIFEKLKEKEEKPKPKVMFDKGENIRIIEGPFSDFNGEIEEISPEKGRLKVMVSIFGRSTPVELESWQVEKI